MNGNDEIPGDSWTGPLGSGISDEARARGLESVKALIANGTFIDAAAGIRLGSDLRQPDELVSYVYASRVYYLASALALLPHEVARVNAALGTAPQEARVLWWIKRHGALGARTVPDALRSGRLSRCVELAEGYAQENGYARSGHAPLPLESRHL